MINSLSKSIFVLLITATFSVQQSYAAESFCTSLRKMRQEASEKLAQCTADELAADREADIGRNNRDSDRLGAALEAGKAAAQCIKERSSEVNFLNRLIEEEC